MFLLLHEVHLRTLLRSIRAVWMLSVMAGISYYLGQRLMPFNSKVDFSSYLILVLSITSKKKFPFKLPKWESDPFTFSTYCLQSTLTSIFSTFTAMAVFSLILIANRFCQHTGILDDYEDACTDWKMLTPALWHFFLQDIGMEIQHYKVVLLGLAHGLLSKGPNQKCCVETSLVGPDLLSVLGFKT